MEQKSMISVTTDSEGADTQGENHTVWFCRDCKASAPVRPNQNDDQLAK
ncbi:MAG TPA: hypothetical protein PK263_00320 [bacterium]|nr:hypothetical protein [bacterium]